MASVIFEKPNGTKVTDDGNGDFTVWWNGSYNFDGFIDPVTYGETFGADGYQHSAGSICRHNNPFLCRDNLSPMERALNFAKNR